MNPQESKLTILSMNIRGQTKLTLQKQLQIQDIIRFNGCDIIHLQETDIDENTFSSCFFISNNFTVISNNSPTGYGTTSLVKNDLVVENISFDTSGRIIVLMCITLLTVMSIWKPVQIQCLAQIEKII